MEKSVYIFCSPSSSLWNSSAILTAVLHIRCCCQEMLITVWFWWMQRKKKAHNKKAKGKCWWSVWSLLWQYSFISFWDSLFSAKTFFQIGDKIVLRKFPFKINNFKHQKHAFCGFVFLGVFFRGGTLFLLFTNPFCLKTVGTNSHTLRAMTFARVIPSCVVNKTLGFIYAGPLIKALMNDELYCLRPILIKLHLSGALTHSYL